MYTQIDLYIAEDSIVWLTLDRPEKHNAFGKQMLTELINAIESLQQQPDLRGLVIRANGQHFSAGADLQWMKQSVNLTAAQNQADAALLATLFNAIEQCHLFTIAQVQGNAYGGALGILCCCDLVLCHGDSHFCFSETSIGLIPATISPYVVSAIGSRHARRYLLSSTVIDAKQAKAIGLVHEYCDDNVELLTDQAVSQILRCCPDAIFHTKQVLQAIDTISDPQVLMEYTSEQIAQRRATTSAQHGLEAFFNRQPPSWRY